MTERGAETTAETTAEMIVETIDAMTAAMTAVMTDATTAVTTAVTIDPAVLVGRHDLLVLDESRHAAALTGGTTVTGGSPAGGPGATPSPR